MNTFIEMFDEFDRRVLPRQLTDADILRLRHEAFALDLDAGNEAQLEDDADHFAFVASGAVKLVAYLEADREQIIAFGFAGELVHVPAAGQRSFSLIALDKAELLVVPASSLFAASRKDNALLRLAIEQTVAALGRSRANSIMLGSRSARQRLAAFLLDMFERTGGRDHNPGSITLPMSRNEISDCLGLTIETVSRQFSEMRQLGLIETPSRSNVTILDWEGLAHAAGQMPEAA